MKETSLLQRYRPFRGWEKYIPFARHTLYWWGLELLVTPTWDRGEAWMSTLRHVAREGRVCVIGCRNAMRLSDVPGALAFKSLLKPDDGCW